ncbi:sn-glycerol-3-phosphate import ATP-binding protein UgpC [Bosea caraganae]|uniref:sn-glycerol-3-phosphate import ATP-binding protein UgpC n=1 Tax=Bosea caraganae TaxID=2763117 RepID=A0A370KYX5_9HYPH|nr:sn-glycerol-3-phosphate import ATP-binding protein UgpC [Bosea caraganae]RDJ20193.1 sn-glycerol-3-phosphate import ATP-binding protein UgpC [Bosea caraganae]RDJ21195.1 sn-glycerol-3-phosphate import ATP-binding protein UgpC [Bosea caraganae]
MAQVTLTNVKKVYAGGVEAVKGVSFDIPDGGFCVLVGPSGCGKSTLLRMVAGLETISSGEVSIGSRVVNQIEPADRDIAMVFQNYALYPHFSVYDNMAYGLRNLKTPKDEIDKRVKEAARILAIENLLERRPRQLSGGQRQRVAMGRAIVRKPQVFLFDEPLSNLDAKLRVQMRVEIKKLQRALGVTSIYVTHDQVEAMTLSDKLVVMNGGQVEQIGVPSDVYRKPASKFVATFIGSPPMNILPAHIDGPGIVALGDAILEARDLRQNLTEGTKVEVGLRPEDIEIASEGAAGTLPFDVEFIEELGATQLFHGKLSGLPFVMQAATDVVAKESKRLWITVDPDRVHVFDATSGARLGRV